MIPFNHKKTRPANPSQTVLSTLTTAALVLPGLLPAIIQAAEDDSVDFQYSHYQEGKRQLIGMVYDADTRNFSAQKLPDNYKNNPIEVDSIHGSARISFTDRVKFAFNYLQDTWSGATPLGTSPVVAGQNNIRYNFAPGNIKILGISGASPLARDNKTLYVDKNLNFYPGVFNPVTFLETPGLKDNRLNHVMSFASPETRKQGDFKLAYEWDEAAISIGGGISTERDYESRFVNLGGRLDFNQKLTSFNWGLSYTNSDTSAILDPDGLAFFDLNHYIQYENGKPAPIAGEAGRLETTDKDLEIIGAKMRGNREDWGGQFGLMQVLSKNSFLEMGVNFTHSEGYLSNPYKLVYSTSLFLTPETMYQTAFSGRLEKRPDERNQFNWHLGYDYYLEALDAALHFDYNFAHDNWSINAHTFEADWVQPLGAGWTLTPRIRYYSQSTADFYMPYFITVATGFDPVTGEPIYTKAPPEFYSSDQRLSGFGALSGGLTLEKRLGKGVSVETGFEYYTHHGSLKIGGGGEQDFADFDYWVANAALKIKLDALGAPSSGYEGHGGHHPHHHANSPAGIMFDHTLPNAGDFMVGYRYMRSEQAGDMAFGNKTIPLGVARTQGCGARECAVTPEFMGMNMHMLDLMYAPTGWLTLMLMPQWMDMEMTMAANPDIKLPDTHGGHQSAAHLHETGGIGDTGFYALFKAYDHPNHHLTLTLGGTAPTGDADITLRKTATNPMVNQTIHYGMQLGSGTWDFKPALTYTGDYENLFWGAQANATIRLEGNNESGYRLGDLYQGSAWGGYQWTNWLATTVRGIYTWQDSIKGHYPTLITTDPFTGNPVPYVYMHNGPFDEPANYGGQFVDLGLGVNVTIPSGTLAGNTLKFEWLQPIHTDHNGYQLDRDYALNFTWSYGF